MVLGPAAAAAADDEWQEGTVPSLETLGGDEHGERFNGAEEEEEELRTAVGFVEECPGGEEEKLPGITRWQERKKR